MPSTNAATGFEVSARARRRTMRRLLPFLFICYLIANLDRVNVAFATLDMSRDLHLSDRVFGLGAGIFFLGYLLLEVPGTLIVERWSARRWFSLILVFWGVVAALTGFIESKRMFYIMRFLLGLGESGFFPGVIVYLTHWFSDEDRAKAAAMFIAASPLANVLGAPIAGLLLRVHWFGIEGWRWLFIVEAVPAVLFGVVTLAYLTDWPHQAQWLSVEERQWITTAREQEEQAKHAVRSYTISQALRQRDVISLTLSYFLFNSVVYGFLLWLPTILKRASGFSNLTVALLAALPYVVGLAGMLLNGWHSDKTRERRWHAALPLYVCGTALLIAAAAGPRFWLTLAMFILVGGSISCYAPPFWALPGVALSETSAAACIGVINSIGSLGGFAGPYMLGYLRTKSQSFATGLIYLVAMAFLAATVVLSVRSGRPLKAAQRNAGDSAP